MAVWLRFPGYYYMFMLCWVIITCTVLKLHRTRFIREDAYYMLDLISFVLHTNLTNSCTQLTSSFVVNTSWWIWNKIRCYCISSCYFHVNLTKKVIETMISYNWCYWIAVDDIVFVNILNCCKDSIAWNQNATRNCISIIQCDNYFLIILWTLY